MNYLERAIKFMPKYFVLAVPLYVLAAIPALIYGTGTTSFYKKVSGLFYLFRDPLQSFNSPGEIFSLLPLAFGLMAGAGILSIIIEFLVKPATFGMIDKALTSNHADLNDYIPALKENIVKYLLYWIGNIIVWLVFGGISAILFIVLALLAVLLKWIGVILIVLGAIAVAIAGVVVGVLLSLWFPAMLVENLDVVSAARKSAEIAKTCFWTILGVTLLVSFIGGIAGSILGFLGLIPLIGPLVLSIIPAATGFIMTVFYIMLYRDKASKAA